MGSQKSVQVEDLKRRGVRGVITCRTCPTPNAEDLERAGIAVMHIKVSDWDTEPISKFFHAAHEFIEKSPGKVLVHCLAGVSRSCTVVVAHLMLKNHWNARKAFTHVQKQRPIVQPNIGFVRQLVDFEQQDRLRGRVEPSRDFVRNYHKLLLPNTLDKLKASRCEQKKRRRLLTSAMERSSKRMRFDVDGGGAKWGWK